MQSQQGMVHAFTCKLMRSCTVFLVVFFLLSLVFMPQVENSQADYRIEGRFFFLNESY